VEAAMTDKVPVKAFLQRWGVSLSLLSSCVLLGLYILWHHPLSSQDPFATTDPSTHASTNAPTEPLNLYQWDSLERMRLVEHLAQKNQGTSEATVSVDYERAAPRDPGVWRVMGHSSPLRLSPFEQVLLENTLTQLRVLNVRRLLLTHPSPEQLSGFGLKGTGSIEVILHGQKNGQLQEQRLLIGDATPTGSGYYFYIPALEQVYLGYVNIPEALRQLLARSAASLS
jgi:hypothetical protein